MVSLNARFIKKENEKSQVDFVNFSSPYIWCGIAPTKFWRIDDQVNEAKKMFC